MKIFVLIMLCCFVFATGFALAGEYLRFKVPHWANSAWIIAAIMFSAGYFIAGFFLSLFKNPPTVDHYFGFVKVVKWVNKFKH